MTSFLWRLFLLAAVPALAEEPLQLDDECVGDSCSFNALQLRGVVKNDAVPVVPDVDDIFQDPDEEEEEEESTTTTEEPEEAEEPKKPGIPEDTEEEAPEESEDEVNPDEATTEPIHPIWEPLPEDANCAEPDTQCGGQDYYGPTCCWHAHTCYKVNEYFSTCITEAQAEELESGLTLTVTTTTTTNSDPQGCLTGYQQCGGWDEVNKKNYSGPTCCHAGFVCIKVSRFFSQCTPTAGTWQYVTASNPPSERVAPAVIDGQQRIWIFGGFRYAGRYQGVQSGSAFFSDLHYFDIQAETWHEVNASSAPSKRNGHTSVIDAQQRIWVFGGYGPGLRFNDLHYFDIQASAWQKVSVQNAPSERDGHTAVMDGKQRMWVFGGSGNGDPGFYNDLHYFDIQAETWREVNANNPPHRRNRHTAVVDAQQRMWIFGGFDFRLVLHDLHYFDIQAQTWQEVKANSPPSKTAGHTAVMDAQQRMWIFGGSIDGHDTALHNLHYFDIEAKAWQEVNASNPFARKHHASVMDEQQRMWIFGGNADDDGWRSWNDLRYFDTQRMFLVEGTTAKRTTKRTTATASKTSSSSTSTTPKATSTTASTTFTTSSTSSISSSTPARNPTTSEDMTSSSTFTSSKKVALAMADSMQPQAEDTARPTSTTGKAEHFLISEPLQTNWALVNVSGEDPLGAEARPDADDSTTLFVVGIVLSVLLTCLFVFLSFCVYRCYRNRKLRQGQAAQAAQAAGASSSPPWPVLPAITSITSITAKPLLFGWYSRMTAEWPRGKVLKLTVGETGFEGNGQRFPFRQADGREFCWEDGTVQRVEKIQKNVVWWRTQHERSEWQHFRWICTPKCSVGGHHDMELTDVDAYRCSSCSSSRVAEKHWHCPAHNVHLCSSCAELPPETATLGVAANYVVNVFPTLASSTTKQENPDFYAICPQLAHGSDGLGANKICPRDGRPQCSVVDALEDAYSGKVTHFVSWCWAYRLQSVVSAVEGWLQKSGEDPHNVFLWMCFFCNNQYRIKQEETQTGSEDLKSIFESHLVEAGQMLVLLETIERPLYITRAWCIFESYVCIARDIPMSIILPEKAEKFFRETVQNGQIHMLSRAVGELNVRQARASSEADEDLIKKLILTDIGFDRVNHAVRSKLIDSFLELFRELFMQPG